jgi:cytochrome d ubiquinol oxidase subunit I
LYDSPWFLRACLGMAPLGFVAVLAGWTTTEVGRQPWTIYGLMRTQDSVPPSLTGSDALLSLLGYMVVYLVIFPAGILVMAKLAAKGPVPGPDADSPIESGRPANPALMQIHLEEDVS